MRPSLDELNRVLAEASEATLEAEPVVDRHDRPAAPEPPPRVIHWRDRGQHGSVTYVGRAMPRQGLAGSPFANPYRVDVDGTRADVVEKYRSWLLNQPTLLDRLRELRGRTLACWCHSQPCHADVLIELVTADAVLDELKAAGVSVEAREGRLRLSPASRVNEALVARMRTLKATLLDLLAARFRPTRRGDNETPEEARLRVAAAEERLRLDRLAFIEEARQAGVYRGG